jgi:hypothetical protein
MIIREVIKLQAHYLKSQIFQFACTMMQNYPHVASMTCMALEIEVQHSVPYIHTQNGLVGSIIKRIKLIVRSLLMNYNYQLDVGVMQLYILLNN